MPSKEEKCEFESRNVKKREKNKKRRERMEEGKGGKREKSN
jgi:hypothetical protein